MKRLDAQLPSDFVIGSYDCMQVTWSQEVVCREQPTVLQIMARTMLQHFQHSFSSWDLLATFQSAAASNLIGVSVLVHQLSRNLPCGVLDSFITPWP